MWITCQPVAHVTPCPSPSSASYSRRPPYSLVFSSSGSNSSNISYLSSVGISSSLPPRIYHQRIVYSCQLFVVMWLNRLRHNYTEFDYEIAEVPISFVLRKTQTFDCSFALICQHFSGMCLHPVAFEVKMCQTKPESSQCFSQRNLLLEVQISFLNCEYVVWFDVEQHHNVPWKCVRLL